LRDCDRTIIIPVIRHQEHYAFGEWAKKSLNGYNLGNDRIRKLYTALTGDDVHKSAFWPKFKDSAKRRNATIHAGVRVSKTEAEESCNAASNLLAHLKMF
jgi:hypothetical protein